MQSINERNREINLDTFRGSVSVHLEGQDMSGKSRDHHLTGWISLSSPTFFLVIITVEDQEGQWLGKQRYVSRSVRHCWNREENCPPRNELKYVV